MSAYTEFFILLSCALGLAFLELDEKSILKRKSIEFFISYADDIETSAYSIERKQEKKQHTYIHTASILHTTRKFSSNADLMPELRPARI